MEENIRVAWFRQPDDSLANKEVSRFTSDHFLSFDFSKLRPARASLRACRLSIETRTT